MWLPVFALCTPLGAPLFVSVTVVRGVSPQAVRRRAYRELFSRAGQRATWLALFAVKHWRVIYPQE